MAQATLLYDALEPGDPEALRVTHFTVREGMSQSFHVTVTAKTKRRDIQLNDLVGARARLLVDPSGGSLGAAHPFNRQRAWSGIVTFFELAATDEVKGDATYVLEIEPELVRLRSQSGCRVFQHKTIPDIVDAILAVRGIAVSWQISTDTYRKLEYRVQYNERDLDFIERMLEEAGISYYFEDDGAASTLVMNDAPQNATPRPPLSYEDDGLGVIERDYVTRVKLSQTLATGAIRARDYDFRSPAFRPTAEARAGRDAGSGLEQYRYAPGYSTVETPNQRSTAPIGDAEGIYRSDLSFANERAKIELDAIRTARITVSYDTNQIALTPGVVFSILNHPHPDLALEKGLVVIESTFAGEVSGPWAFSGRAVFASTPFRPPTTAQKPRVFGAQTAVVVGPKDQEIYVDERGRVRVQFHWEFGSAFGALDEHASCWVRVSQSWAGGGYGTMAIPRIGQEVLVFFLDGDPDQPVVGGRLFDETQPVPYSLPENKTVSTWKSHSTPSSSGFNEIKFDDKAGDELVYMQAEKNQVELIKNDETITVGNDRSADVGKVDATLVGTKFEVIVRQPSDPPPTVPPTRFTMIDKKITLTTGDATIELDGPDIKLMAKGNILLSAGKGISMSGYGNNAMPGPAKELPGGGVSIVSLKTLDIASIGAMTIATSNDLKVAAGQELSLVGGSEAYLASGGNVDIASKGGSVRISGGPLVEINPIGELFAGRVTEQAPGTITTGAATVLIGGPSFPFPVVRLPDGTLKLGDHIFIKPSGGRYKYFESKMIRQLGTMASTPTGLQRLNNIQNNPGGHNVTIREYSAEDEQLNGTNNSVTYGDQPSGTLGPTDVFGQRRAGPGSDAEIGYNPDTIDGPDSQKPQDATLFHELGHADHFVNGTNRGDEGAGPSWGTQEERQNIQGGVNQPGGMQVAAPENDVLGAPPPSPSENQYLADRGYSFRRTDHRKGYATPDGHQVTDPDGNPVP